MADTNKYLQRPGESIGEWTKRLDAIDSKTLEKDERVKYEDARRGIPPRGHHSGTDLPIRKGNRPGT
jgi:hypothetical protein